MTQFYVSFFIYYNFYPFFIFNKILSVENILINKVSRTSHYTNLKFRERVEIIDTFLF